MSEANTPSASSPRLLDQLRDRIRVKHYSIRTETQYMQWVKRFVLFHGKRHPRDLGAPEVEAFLTHLAVEGQVASSTQNQALSALLFLYREVYLRTVDLDLLQVTRFDHDDGARCHVELVPCPPARMIVVSLKKHRETQSARNLGW